MNILLSAGHGANDPGAVNGSNKEAELTRELVNVFKETLSKQGHTVSLRSFATNEYDEALSLNFKKYDLVISIHLNAASASATGVETWVSKSYPRSSAAIAKKVNDAIADGMKWANRGVKQEDWRICYLAGKQGVNAMLIEFGFISNTSDLEKIKSILNKQPIVEQPKPTDEEKIMDRYPEKGQFTPNVAEGGIYVRTEPKYTSKSSAMYYNGEICPAKGQYYTEVVITNKYVYIAYKRSNGSTGYLPVRERGGALWGKLD